MTSLVGNFLAVFLRSVFLTQVDIPPVDMKYQDYTVDQLQQALNSMMQRVERFNVYVDRLTGCKLISGSEAIELQMRLEIIEPLYKEFDDIATRLERLGLHNIRTNFEATYFKSVSAAKDMNERKRTQNVMF